jgi:hydrogenase nickel insertion protein HypA
MHEYSIVMALVEQVEQIAAQNSATKVTQIEVKIGVMSGVEPHLLEIAFETFKEKTMCESAKFVMNVQALVVQCLACDAKSELALKQYHCPLCKSHDIKVLDGEEMLLMRLEME